MRIGRKGRPISLRQLDALMKEDRKVVNAFVAYLQDNGYPGLQVDLYPEDDNDADIDAIAGRFAIEHTSVDTLPNQRRDSDWFMRAAGGLEDEIQNKPPFRLRIGLEYHAVTKGQDWSAIREALRTWINKESPRLPDGRHVLENVPGVPFRLYVTKARDRAPGIFFARFEPQDDSLSERIKEQFERKARKLAKYKRLGLTTILLVENKDIALMNEIKMLQAIRAAYPAGPPHGVDEVWFVDTSIPSAIEFYNFTPTISATPSLMPGDVWPDA